MPLASEGTLANYPMKISCEQALVLIAQVMDAVVYMHQNGYTHRDLKPANILLTREGRDLKAIVADFGISEHGETHTSKSGTQGFRAPEVLGQPTHDKKVDSWAIGLILWDMLFGTTYFVDDPSAKPNTINWDLIKAKKAKEVKEAKGSIAQRASNNLWSQVDDFLRGLLTVTPNERWSVEVARQDPLLQHIAPTVATGRPSPAVTVVPTISSTEDTPVAGPSGPAHLSNGSKLRSVPNVSSTSSLLLEGPPTSIKRKREVSSPMAPPPEATATDNLVPNAKRRREKGRGKFCRGN
ncbi:Calcium/calmodulin-dependent protein kinase type 1D [Tulasnella sp. JGI-2019a]|nr:Calcium/calmodulin-dependent protein kinase type 1D [Tulasnella sp. JGI-2019a]